jgi:hypothetical protein
MIDLPPEFYGMVTALWSTYQYTILIFMGFFLAGVMLLTFGIIAWQVVRGFWSV